MDRHQRLSNRFFLLGMGLICLIGYTLLLAAIAFIRGQVMNPYIFPVAVAMTGITQFFAAKALFPDSAVRKFFEGLLILLAIAGLSVLTAFGVYDVSFEGQWYHQETVHQLKTGWNPYLKYLEAPLISVSSGQDGLNCYGRNPGRDSGSVTTPDPKYNLINYEPKGIEIVGAAVYSLTGRIETAKAVNLFALLGAGCLCLAWLYRQPNLSVGKKWMLAVMAACNPWTILQLPTFGNTGTAAALCLALLVSTLLIAGSIGYNRIFLYGLLLIICINIQPPASIFAALIAVGFLLFLFIKKDRVNLKKIFYASLLAAATGLIFIGFHPYVTNFISGENLLHHLDNAGKSDSGTVYGRYFGYTFPLWCVPVAALLLAERLRQPAGRVIRFLLWSGMTLVLAWSAGGLGFRLLASARVGYQLQQMKALNEPVTLEICGTTGFQSNEWRLREDGIPYNLGELTAGHIENIIQSTTRIGTEEPLPPLPKPFFVRRAENISGDYPGLANF